MFGLVELHNLWCLVCVRESGLSFAKCIWVTGEDFSLHSQRRPRVREGLGSLCFAIASGDSRSREMGRVRVGVVSVVIMFACEVSHSHKRKFGLEVFCSSQTRGNFRVREEGFNWAVD